MRKRKEEKKRKEKKEKMGGGEGQRDQGVPLQTAGPQAPRTGDFGLGSASSG